MSDAFGMISFQLCSENLLVILYDFQKKEEEKKILGSFCSVVFCSPSDDGKVICVSADAASLRVFYSYPARVALVKMSSPLVCCGRSYILVVHTNSAIMCVHTLH